jgi:hypothetical protein
VGSNPTGDKDYLFDCPFFSYLPLAGSSLNFTTDVGVILDYIDELDRSRRIYEFL